MTQLPDGSVFFGQQYYVEDRKRKQRRFARCTSQQVEYLCGALGTLSGLSKETRSDLAGRAALLRQSFPHP